jgi:hypothetical protein
MKSFVVLVLLLELKLLKMIEFLRGSDNSVGTSDED